VHAAKGKFFGAGTLEKWRKSRTFAIVTIPQEIKDVWNVEVITSISV
jgi:hypothetical protein